MKTNGVGTVEV